MWECIAKEKATKTSVLSFGSKSTQTYLSKNIGLDNEEKTETKKKSAWIYMAMGKKAIKNLADGIGQTIVIRLIHIGHIA